MKNIIEKLKNFSINLIITISIMVSLIAVVEIYDRIKHRCKDIAIYEYCP